jgi:hypothetical protein
MCGLTIYWTISLLFVTSWMTRLIEMTTAVSPGHNVSLAQTCLHLYTSFDRGFGTYFLLVFSYSQVLWICCVFLAFSSVFYGTFDAPTVCKIIGFLVSATAIVLQICAFTLVLDEGHRSLGVLSK